MKPSFLASDGLLVLLGILALSLTVFYLWLYRQESLHAQSLKRGQQWLLRGLRILAALLVMLAIARPSISLIKNEERLPVIPILIDDSASMTFPDTRDNPWVEASDPDARKRSNTAHTAVLKLQSKLSLTHRVKIFQFSDAIKLLKELPHRKISTEPTATADDIFGAVPPVSAGQYSNIGDAIKDVLRDLSGDQISGLVVISDGQQTGGASLKDAGALAATAQVPIHTVALGSEFPLKDLRIDEVLVGAEANLGDVLTFHVKVTNQMSANFKTELTLFEEGKKTSTKTLTLTRGQSLVSISTIPEVEGEREFRLVFPKYPDEINATNNEATVKVNTVKRTLKALLIAGQPTREYFYLVPALLRDPIIDLSCILQTADVDYIQQGNTSIERLPQSTEEWSKFDVAILYDVDPNGLSTQQIAGLETMVNKGGGLLVIAGCNHGLAKLIQVHSAKIRGLLPVEIDKNALLDYDKIYDKSFQSERTPQGKGHPILMASTHEKINEQMWNSFPTMFWSHSVQSVKPKAISLLKNKEDGSCLMAIHRYGEGAVFYSGLNSLWRWRYPSESFDYDRLWVRAIRYLGETRLHGTQQQVALSTERRTYAPGEEIQISLRVLDPALMSQLAGQRVCVSVISPLKDEQIVELRAEQDGSPVYRGSSRARQVGNTVLKARQSAPDADSESKPLFEVKHSFVVKMESLEDRDSSANLKAMEELADQTNGKYYDYRNIQDLENLVEIIPIDPQLLTTQVLVEMWDGLFFLIVFLVLVCAEWSLRKLWGLL